MARRRIYRTVAFTIVAAKRVWSCGEPFVRGVWRVVRCVVRNAPPREIQRRRA